MTAGEPVGATGGPEYEVAIVGGGPVGMGLALELGLRGVRCAVVERHERPPAHTEGPEPHPAPPWSTSAPGAWESAVRSARVMPADAPTSGVTAYGTLLGRLLVPVVAAICAAPLLLRGQRAAPAVLHRGGAAGRRLLRWQCGLPHRLDGDIGNRRGPQRGREDRRRWPRQPEDAESAVRGGLRREPFNGAGTGRHGAATD